MNTVESVDPKAFTDILIGDVTVAQERLKNADTQSNRRDLVRTAMAASEGLLWFLKVQVFERRRAACNVTSTELDAIFERSFAVAENGAVREVPKFLPTLTTIRLLAKILGRQFPSFQPHFDGDGWQRMRAAIAVRHRISHPKSAEDLFVSLDDAKNASGAFAWTLAFVLSAAAEFF